MTSHDLLELISAQRLDQLNQLKAISREEKNASSVESNLRPAGLDELSKGCTVAGDWDNYGSVSWEYMYLYVAIYTYVCICIYIYIYTYVCIYIYVIIVYMYRLLFI